jgi:hypothetical protein
LNRRLGAKSKSFLFLFFKKEILPFFVVVSVFMRGWCYKDVSGFDFASSEINRHATDPGEAMQKTRGSLAGEHEPRLTRTPEHR